MALTIIFNSFAHILSRTKIGRWPLNSSRIWADLWSLKQLTSNYYFFYSKRLYFYILLTWLAKLLILGWARFVKMSGHHRWLPSISHGPIEPKAMPTWTFSVFSFNTGNPLSVRSLFSTGFPTHFRNWSRIRIQTFLHFHYRIFGNTKRTRSSSDLRRRTRMLV